MVFYHFILHLSSKSYEINLKIVVYEKVYQTG